MQTPLECSNFGGVHRGGVKVSFITGFKGWQEVSLLTGLTRLWSEIAVKSGNQLVACQSTSFFQPGRLLIRCPIFLRSPAKFVPAPESKAQHCWQVCCMCTQGYQNPSHSLAPWQGDGGMDHICHVYLDGNLTFQGLHRIARRTSAQKSPANGYSEKFSMMLLPVFFFFINRVLFLSNLFSYRTVQT